MSDDLWIAWVHGAKERTKHRNEPCASAQIAALNRQDARVPVGWPGSRRKDASFNQLNLFAGLFFFFFSGLCRVPNGKLAASELWRC